MSARDHPAATKPRGQGLKNYILRDRWVQRWTKKGGKQTNGVTFKQKTFATMEETAPRSCQITLNEP